MKGNKPIYIIPVSIAHGAAQMAYDMKQLEKSSALDAMIFRHYRFAKPTISFGYTQSYQDIASTVKENDYDLVRRPTGGGIVDHTTDWTYSITLPNTHSIYKLKAEDSYKWVHEIISTSLGLLGIDSVLHPCTKEDKSNGECNYQPIKISSCATEPVTSDVIHGGHKIAGAAQKRTKSGLLIQGSIFTRSVPLSLPADFELTLAKQLSHRKDIELAHLTLAEIQTPSWQELSQSYQTYEWLKKR